MVAALAGGAAALALVLGLGGTAGLALEREAGAEAPRLAQVPADGPEDSSGPTDSTGARLAAGPTSPGTAQAEAQREAPRPREVRIPTLGLALPVVPQGVTRDGAMALPESPSVLGWYRFGPRPGDDAGATVIAGHVDSVAEGVGPLAGLAGLRGGDEIVVGAGGDRVRYEVTSVSRVDKDEIDLEAVFARDGRPRLHLVTCAGAFDAEAGGYQDNLVVVARRVAG